MQVIFQLCCPLSSLWSLYEDSRLSPSWDLLFCCSVVIGSEWSLEKHHRHKKIAESQAAILFRIFLCDLFIQAINADQIPLQGSKDGDRVVLLLYYFNLGLTKQWSCQLSSLALWCSSLRPLLKFISYHHMPLLPKWQYVLIIWIDIFMAQNYL